MVLQGIAAPQEEDEEELSREERDVRQQKKNLIIISCLGSIVCLPFGLIPAILRTIPIDSSYFEHLRQRDVAIDRASVIMAHNSDTFWGSSTLFPFSNQMLTTRQILEETPATGISLDTYMIASASSQPIINHGGVYVSWLSGIRTFGDSLSDIKAALGTTDKLVYIFIENYVKQSVIDQMLNETLGNEIFYAKEQDNLMSMLGRIPTIDEVVSGGNRVIVMGSGGTNLLETYFGSWNSTRYISSGLHLNFSDGEDRTWAGLLGTRVAAGHINTDRAEELFKLPGMVLLDKLEKHDPRFFQDKDRSYNLVFRPNVSILGGSIYIGNDSIRCIAFSFGVFLPSMGIALSLRHVAHTLTSIFSKIDRGELADYILKHMDYEAKCVLLSGNICRAEEKREFLLSSTRSSFVHDMVKHILLAASNLYMLSNIFPIWARAFAGLSISSLAVGAMLTFQGAVKIKEKHGRREILTEGDYDKLRRVFISKKTMLWHKSTSLYNRYSRKFTYAALILKISAMSKITMPLLNKGLGIFIWAAHLQDTLYSAIRSYRVTRAAVTNTAEELALIVHEQINKSNLRRYIEKNRDKILCVLRAGDDVESVRESIEIDENNAAIVKMYRGHNLIRKILKEYHGGGINFNSITVEEFRGVARNFFSKSIENKTKSHVRRNGLGITSRLALMMSSIGLLAPSVSYIFIIISLFVVVMGVPMTISISRAEGSRHYYKAMKLLDNTEGEQRIQNCEALNAELLAKNDRQIFLLAFLGLGFGVILFLLLHAAIGIPPVSLLANIGAPTIGLISVLYTSSRFSERINPCVVNDNKRDPGVDSLIRESYNDVRLAAHRYDDRQRSIGVTSATRRRLRPMQRLMVEANMASRPSDRELEQSRVVWLSASDHMPQRVATRPTSLALTSVYMRNDHLEAPVAHVPKPSKIGMKVQSKL